MQRHIVWQIYFARWQLVTGMMSVRTCVQEQAQ